jgi:hypothetical protein
VPWSSALFRDCSITHTRRSLAFAPRAASCRSFWRLRSNLSTRGTEHFAYAISWRTSSSVCASLISDRPHPVRIAPPCSRDTDCLAGSCQLLYRGNTDRERRKVRYARFDRRSSDVAVRDKVARDERRQWKVRDSSGQRPWSVRSRTSCRCLLLRG